jgi:hypothetical protein
LKIDLDDMREAPDIDRMARILARADRRITKFHYKRSPSGTGWHVWLHITPPAASPMEIVALQAVCGSDPAREANNIHRVRNMHKVSQFWRDRWNTLYR